MHFILPSFFNTINKLQEDGRDFTIVIRTFGTDLPEILECLDAFARGFHPHFIYFKNDEFITAEEWEGLKMQWKDDGTFTVSNKVKTINGDDELLAVLQNHKLICIQDDYDYWCNNNYSPSAGKPVFINRDNKKYVF